MTGTTLACPLCQSKRTAMIGRVRAGEVARCLDCGLAWAIQTPTAEERFDQDAYGDEFFDDFVDPQFHRERERVLRLHLSQIDALRPPGGRILDVGAATGEFVALAKEAGWETTGVEPAATAVARARGRGRELLQGSVDHPGLQQGAFDAIHLSHVVEHMPDPFAALRTCAGLLADGGVIGLEVPNELDNLFRTVRRVIRRTAPDELGQFHVWFFTPETIRRTVEEAGFQVELVRTRSITPLDSRLPLGAIVKRAIDAVSRRTQRGEVIEVYGRKRRTG